MTNDPNDQDQQPGRGPTRRQYERVMGSGVTVSVEMRNHALGRTFRTLAEKVDNQLSLIARRRDYLPQWQLLEQLNTEQTQALAIAIERLEGMLTDEGIKPAHAGKPYRAEFVCTTPLTRRFIRALAQSDKALSDLHALWVADVIDEAEFRKQGNKLRSRAHDFSRACDEAFRKLYRSGDQASSDSPEPGAVAADTGQEGSDQAPEVAPQQPSEQLVARDE